MMIPNEIMAYCLTENDNQTFLLVDDVRRGKTTFEDDTLQSCIAVNNMRGSIELLKLCAERFTSSEKEKYIVMQFINQLEAISEVACAKGNIEVVE